MEEADAAAFEAWLNQLPRKFVVDIPLNIPVLLNPMHVEGQNVQGLHFVLICGRGE
jgi:hypothetical protein